MVWQKHRIEGTEGMATPIKSNFPQKLARAAIGSAVYAGLAFLGAGRMDWPRGWAYFIVFVLASAVGALIVGRANPAVLEARAKGLRQGTKPFDKLFYLMFLPLVLSAPVVAGMDAVRWSWRPLPLWTFAPGVALFLIGSALTAWTLIANPFAECTVRIQGERDQTVIASGPYAIVRHPMYLATVFGFPATALMLGSTWALVPAVLLIALFVWRTALEDRTLRRELTGYEAYTERTRYRLLPYIW